MTLYHGNTKIRDENQYGVYKGSQPIGAIYKGNDKVYFVKKSYTYTPTESFQIYTVPKWVTKIRVDCVAASGMLHYSENSGSQTAGRGGRVQCDLTVTPGQTLYIFVGRIPTQTANAEYNASDIRTNNAGVTNTTSLQSRIVVAGGGGSGGRNTNRHYRGSGGNGGGLIGENGEDRGFGATGGTGGTQTEGGTYDGQFGLGGGGQDSGGGAGWYGGGRGKTVGTGSTYYTGGGGGGSSYTSPTLCSNVVHTQGYQYTNGYVKIEEIE